MHGSAGLVRAMIAKSKKSAIDRTAQDLRESGQSWRLDHLRLLLETNRIVLLAIAIHHVVN
jgi:hypothetical protein